MKRDFGVFQVALKVLLQKGGKFLFLRASDDGMLDIPGGRIDNVEYKVPLKKIIEREVREELGVAVRYKIGRPVFQFRVYNRYKKIYIFKTVYEAEYISGKIRLSSEHNSYGWIDPKSYKFKRKDFTTEEEFLAYK